MTAIPVDHERADRSLVERVTNTIQGGGIVAMRTDTVYGLLASVNRPDALRRLVDMKDRPVNKPFILLASGWIGVRSVTSQLTPVARRLGTRYWPGPLTLVLPASEDLPPEVTAAGATVAVRVPADPLLQEILGGVRCALAAPSANLAGGEPATEASQVCDAFGDSVDLVLDGGPVTVSQPSTIVSCLGNEVTVLRKGPLAIDDRDLVNS